MNADIWVWGQGGASLHSRVPHPQSSLDRHSLGHIRTHAGPIGTAPRLKHLNLLVKRWFDLLSIFNGVAIIALFLTVKWEILILNMYSRMSSEKKMHSLPLGRCTGLNTNNDFTGAKGIAEQMLVRGRETRKEPGLPAKGERYRIISIFDLCKCNSWLALHFKSGRESGRSQGDCSREENDILAALN